ETLAVLPGQHRNTLPGEIPDDTPFQRSLLGAKVNIVFPGQDFQLGIETMTLLGHHSDTFRPFLSPFFEILAMPPILVVKAFSQEDVSLDLRKFRHNVAHQLAKTPHVVRFSRVAINNRRIDFYPEAGGSLN